MNKCDRKPQYCGLFIMMVLAFTFYVLISKNSKTTLVSTQNTKMIEHNRSSFTVLSANVGNLTFGCRHVLNNLCYKDVEERITDNIRLLKPDIIALQEVLAPWQCNQIKEKNKNKVCYYRQTIPQIRRLVGNEYTIACDTRNQFECIAIHIDAGKILGCSKGEICNRARTITEVTRCDNGFTVSAVTVKLRNNLIIDVVNFHPQSTNARCRSRMIARAFDSAAPSPLIQQNHVLLLGDFNLDPWRDDDESVHKWKGFFEKGWANRSFRYHSGIVERDPPYFTSFLFFKKRTVDFVVSNFATGICHVLGESPGTKRLDGGRGTDHRALFGILEMAPK